MGPYEQARTSLVTRLQKEGWSVSPNALDPLEQIDFNKLVTIYDHEERFLEETFINTLLALRSGRARTPLERGEITASDVETALLMLAVAIPRQRRETLSPASKRIITDACGFC